jgi:hypothetical protein
MGISWLSLMADASRSRICRRSSSSWLCRFSMTSLWSLHEAFVHSQSALHRQSPVHALASQCNKSCLAAAVGKVEPEFFAFVSAPA